MPSSCPAVTAQSCPATKQCLQYKSSISGGKSPETIWPVTEIRKTVLLSANDMITINTTQVHWWFQQWAFIFSEGFLYKRHPHTGTYLVLKKVTQPTLSVHLSVIMKLCCLLTTYVDVFFLIPVKLFLEISLRKWMICNVRISLPPYKIGEWLLNKGKASVRHMNHNFKKIGTKRQSWILDCLFQSFLAHKMLNKFLLFSLILQQWFIVDPESLKFVFFLHNQCSQLLMLLLSKV